MKQVTTISLCLLFLFVGLRQEVEAQDTIGKFLKDTAKDVIFDPTTYPPALINFTARKLDWESSQIFFRNGYLEENSNFTISGKANDLPISHSAGNRRIIIETLPVFELSLLNNTALSISERLLIHFYPSHKKLIKSIGWVEKVAATSYSSYYHSEKIFRQWQKNKRLASELGLR